MTDWIEHAVAALGVRGLETAPEPAPVTLIPDDYNPPRRLAGLVGVGVAGGGAGLRSQIMLIAAGADRTGTLIEIPFLWLASTTADVEMQVVTRATGAGTFVDIPAISSDLRAGRSALRVQTKNDAAAVAATSIIGDVIVTGPANVYVGPLPLNALLEVGALLDANAIILRPAVDNVSIRMIASYRELRHRKL